MVTKPPTGVLTVRVPIDILAALDADVIARHKANRSDYINSMLAAAFANTAKRTANPHPKPESKHERG